MTTRRFRVAIKVYPDGRAYLTKEVRNAGFTGELEGVPDHATFLLIQPGSTLEEIKDSIKFHLTHIEAEIRRKKREEVEDVAVP